jgi:biotin synthase
MLGIGPFIPHKDTPFADFPAGSAELTLFLLALSRLLLPKVLLPATTALGTLDEFGREKAVLAGANVVMPNLSPLNVREQYMLYNNKIATGLEAAEGVKKLAESMTAIGYELAMERGDFC